MANNSLNFVASEFAEIEFSTDGGANWLPIPGVSSYSETGGEAPERDIVAFEGVGKATGHPRVPTIEMAAIYSPAHNAWRALYQKSQASEQADFRVTTRKVTLYTGSAAKTAAVATTGVVTFVADGLDVTQPKYARGQAIVIGGTAYVVDDISDAATPIVMVKPAPDAAVAAAAFTWINPSLRRIFAATIRSIGRAALESEGDLSTTLSLAPTNDLADWTILAT